MEMAKCRLVFDFNGDADKKREIQFSKEHFSLFNEVLSSLSRLYDVVIKGVLSSLYLLKCEMLMGFPCLLKSLAIAPASNKPEN